MVATEFSTSTGKTYIQNGSFDSSDVGKEWVVVSTDEPDDPDDWYSEGYQPWK